MTVDARAGRVARARPARTSPAIGRSRLRPSVADVTGSLSLEAVLILPVLALAVVALLGAVGVLRDVLLVHEAARAGARVAATTSGSAPVVRAARQAAPELVGLRVEVTPTARRDGDVAAVEVVLDRRAGPVSHQLRARAVARVEPAIGPAGAVSAGSSTDRTMADTGRRRDRDSTEPR